VTDTVFPNFTKRFVFKGAVSTLSTMFCSVEVVLFTKRKHHIAKQATNAMYNLISKCESLEIPINMQIDLFNKMIKPILLHCIWL